jgi:hypothetical protein
VRLPALCSAPLGSRILYYALHRGSAANFCLERHALPNLHIPQQDNHWIDLLIPFSLLASARHVYVSESHIKRNHAPFRAFRVIDGILRLDEKERSKAWE